MEVPAYGEQIEAHEKLEWSYIYNLENNSRYSSMRCGMFTTKFGANAAADDPAGRRGKPGGVL